MRLVEVFLPLQYGDGQPVPAAIFELLKQELADTFGGVTAYGRSAAEGLWKSDDTSIGHAVIVFEVMTDEVDKTWWTQFRQRLEALLRQDEVFVRSTHVARL